MLSTLSSNVVLSKARAMYGRRLTEQNYKELLACQSVGEVATYLKSRTVYKKALAGVNEYTIHRGQLEAHLKQKLFDDFASLCRYEISVGEHFSEYFIIRSEIDQILHSLILLSAGKPEEYLFSMPMFLSRHARIDLNALTRIKSFDDLLAALNHTPYRDLLESFRPVGGLPLNYTGIENALYTYLYSSVFKIIDRYTKGQNAEQLREIFNTYLDLLNYSRIIRLKTSYQGEPDFIRSALLPFGDLRKNVLDQMIAAPTEQEINAVWERTSLGKKSQRVAYADLDELPNRVKYFICRYDIHFSTHPSVVLMAYSFILQTEITDIITIVEGVRYHLPPDEIEKMLVIYHAKRKE